MRYIHDCDKCHFLGIFQQADLYFCPAEPPDREEATVVARFSNEGSDYTSGLVSAHRSVHLVEALRRARECNMLPKA